ncbi:MAG: D-alanyl-D-alanine carboxypeptidase/D-alanyl-D-alanine-endopeptidase [Ignavibacteria bacterium]
MLKTLRTLLGLAFLAVPFASPAGAAAPDGVGGRLPAPVAEALKAFAIPPAAVAVYVQEVGAAAPRLAINAGRPMNPASVMKLVTTYTALGMLGPAYTWKTEVRADAPVTEGRLAGNLYIRGSGDPKLTFEQFWLLLRQLRAQGIRDIEGDLVLDRSIFQVPADEAAFDDQPLRAYNVAPDALLVGFKAIRIGLAPDPAARAVQLAVEPQPANLDVVNRIRLGNNGCGDWKDALRADLSRHAERFRLVVTGSYSASCGQKNWLLGVMPHDLYVRGVFEQLWSELGGSIKGGVRDGAAPAGARLVASIESPGLAEIVRDINKFSNNVMARQLFLTLGAENGKRPARPADAESTVREWLAAHGLAFPDLVIENGSGLSRQERVTAESLGRLLQSAWKSPLMPEFVASLPLAAVDGTMKKRFNGNGAAGQMHIKTGTLEGVKSIAGYVLDAKGRNQAVVFIINHPNAQAGQAAQDALLQWVYEGGS